MNIRVGSLPFVLLMLGACDVESVETNGTNLRFITQLPEAVTAVAAPFQNLEAVVLLPDDNCYWYNHAGPVETTLLPLRTTQGRPICVERAEVAPAQ
ncbi:MAG: hypothetical protein NWP79_08085 [Paracoccaceae bacterium]|nr:hypothetical protein [Paracoccaceae bacterium]